ncbi:MAG: hypothetical protein Q7J65_01335 [Candidatus Marinimicrobia bacterium]|nr:hypothetical protein [Candidatus Neomarinimicrobiota bacterium]
MRNQRYHYQIITAICILWMALVWGFQRCEEGLDPVAGIEGIVHFPVDLVSGVVMFPDSLKGAVVVVAEFRTDYSSVDSFFAHIVAYGSALDTTVAEAPYYIQLPSGFYLVGVVGIKNISLAQILFTPADSLALHPDYFQPIGLYKIPGGSLPMASVRVGEEELVSDINIDVDYDLELPF